jgi:hypothetical protein
MRRKEEYKERKMGRKEGGEPRDSVDRGRRKEEYKKRNKGEKGRKRN